MTFLKKVLTKISLIILMILPFSKRNFTKTNNKKVLIVMSGLGIGDGILFYNCVYNLALFYGNENITILAPKGIIDLYKIAFGEFEFIYIEYKYSSIKEFINIVGIVNKYIYKLIINPNHFRKDIDALVSKVNADWKISVQTRHDRSFGYRMYNFFTHKLYDCVIDVQPGTMELKRYCMLYEKCTGQRMLCDKPRIRGNVLNEFRKSRDDIPYVVVSVGSSNEARCWEAKKYAEIVEWLLKETNLNIYITGSNKVDENHIGIIKNVLGEAERVRYIFNKTNMYEWMKLISRASFLVGNDSGAAHMGAFLETAKVFVISDKSRKLGNDCRYFPYIIDRAVDNERLPIIIRTSRNMKCEGCAELSNGVYGYRNKICKTRIQNGGNCMCLNDIGVDDVKDLMKKYLHN